MEEENKRNKLRGGCKIDKQNEKGEEKGRKNKAWKPSDKG